MCSGEDQRRQWPHYELMSGVSPYTFVIGAPFHDLDDDGGVFYLDLEKISFNDKRRKQIRNSERSTYT